MLNSLVQKYLGSIIRNAMTATAVYLIAHGVITQEQSGVLVSSPLIETVAAIVLWLASLLLSLAQKRTQERVFQTALQANPKTAAADVVTLVKQGFGVPISFLGKVLGMALLVVLLPTIAGAQDLRASAVKIAREYAATMQPAATQPATSMVEPTDTWLRALEVAFITANAADVAASCVAVRQKDVNGKAINEPVNVLIPSSCQGILTEKAGIVIGGLVAAEKLWPDHKWEAILALGGATIVSFASSMKSVYEVTQPGEYPAPQGCRFAVRFTIAR